MISPEVGFMLGSLGLGGAVWALRLEGRVDTQEKLNASREKQLDERHDDLKARLVRIEDKLDMWRSNEQTNVA